MYRIDFRKPAHVHFIGIGGISMSGLAHIMRSYGFTVTGSDRQTSALTDRLAAEGVRISCPQSAANVTGDIDFFVYTAAIHPDNPEFAAAQATGKPMLTRAELLGQIMDRYPRSVAVAGTHGKTTTTSMISQVLLNAEADPTITVGAVFDAIHSNVRIGHSDVFVAEACEYTDSFLNFHPQYSVILNIDAEHLDYFKTLENERRSFHKFARNTKEGGLLLINGEIPDYQEITADTVCRTETYGTRESDDWRAQDISYDDMGCASFVPVHHGTLLPRVTLHVPGRHNILNALAVTGLLSDAGLSPDLIAAGLSAFRGAERRFEYKGTLASGAVVIDDYAHHPTEIRATLSACTNVKHDRLICIFQPHTYTRLKNFLPDFVSALSLADIVILADVYAAREKDIYGISSADLAAGLTAAGTECHYFHTFPEIEEFAQKISRKGDLLITMGAGDIVKVGDDLLQH